MSQSTACQSSQYKAIQNLYADLVQAIYPELQIIMAKAFSKNIIGQELLDLSNESSITTNNKAKIFMSAIVSRINLDSNAFDVFLSLLKEVESLGYMIERLKQEVANLQRGGQLAHNTSVQTTAQMPKLDVHEEPNIKTNDDKDLTEDVVNTRSKQEVHDLRQREQETALKRRFFLCGCYYTVLLLTTVFMSVVGAVGIGLGAHMIVDGNDCTVMTQFNGRLAGSLGFQGSVFVLVIGIALQLGAMFSALLTPYYCCRLFGKCQHRGWRVPLCIGAPLGICGLITALPTLGYSIFIGVSFYPLTQQEFEVADCLRIRYYSIFIFLVITHVVSLCITFALFVSCVTFSIYAYIKCTIFGPIYRITHF